MKLRSRFFLHNNITDQLLVQLPSWRRFNRMCSNRPYLLFNGLRFVFFIYDTIIAGFKYFSPVTSFIFAQIKYISWNHIFLWLIIRHAINLYIYTEKLVELITLHYLNNISPLVPGSLSYAMTRFLHSG